MKIILKDDVPNLGEVGQVVSVADGFGRNYLIPRGLAAPATPQNIKALERDKSLIRKRDEKRVGEAGELAQRLLGVVCTFPMKAGEGDKLFGSVTSADIAKKLEEHGIALERKKIHLEHPIKSLGIFSVPLKLHTEVSVELKVEVVKKEE